MSSSTASPRFGRRRGCGGLVSARAIGGAAHRGARRDARLSAPVTGDRRGVRDLGRGVSSQLRRSGWQPFNGLIAEPSTLTAREDARCSKNRQLEPLQIQRLTSLKRERDLFVSDGCEGSGSCVTGVQESRGFADPARVGIAPKNRALAFLDGHWSGRDSVLITRLASPNPAHALNRINPRNAARGISVA